MLKFMALVGLWAAVFSSGCAHECRCVCLHEPGRTVGGRNDDAPAVPPRLHRVGRRVVDPVAMNTPPPKSKPWGYPDPFESHAVDLFERHEGSWLQEKSDAAEHLLEAETLASKRSHPERSRQEEDATFRAQELQQRLEQLARP